MANNSAELVGVCHPKWRGIRSATYALTPKVVEVAEIHSLSVADEEAKNVLQLRPTTVLLSGYPSGYDLLAKSLKQQAPEVRVFFFSHTPFTWYTDRLKEVSWLERMFVAYKDGHIDKIGFCKKDVASYFKAQGMNSFFVMNRLPKYEECSHKLNLATPSVGVWGSHLWHRNLLNQTLGTLMVKNATVHLNELPDYFFLDESRVKRHGILPKEEYLPLMRSIDVNLYVSFTDCFPMTVVESMAYGIPCITSNTSDIYAWSDYLKENMIISKIDSPLAIKEKIEWVFQHYGEIQEKMRKYLPILNTEVEKTIAEFLA